MAKAMDTANELESRARELDYLLYEDGKTSPTIAQPKPLDAERCRKELEELRQFMWQESKDLREAIRGGY